MLAALALMVCLATATGESAPSDPVMRAMEEELAHSFEWLREEEDPVYFLQYAVADEDRVSLLASYGAMQREYRFHRRYLTVDARMGSPSLDSTHEIRGEDSWSDWWWVDHEFLPLDDDTEALRAALWSETDEAHRAARERYVKVRADKALRAVERDTSADFSPYPPQVFVGEKVALEYDPGTWQDRLRRLSGRFTQHDWIHDCRAHLWVEATNKYLINTEGSRVRMGVLVCSLTLRAETVAEDGTVLSLTERFDSRTLEELPAEDVMAAALDSLVLRLGQLRVAPVTDPYVGPAILMNKVGGVLFHEVLGHRLEGHRQKSEEEGQTFTRKIGEKVLPDFLSVYDDPTLASHDGVVLKGHYLYDDEGVPAQRVDLIQNGVLKGFLMSQSPIEGFPVSNGHGRRQSGYRTAARQGNLLVESSQEVSGQRLRQMLMEECKERQKPYGLIFHQVEGGFTTTGRWTPQVFSVIPLYVTRLYPDGREELIRGVDIVGTPLTVLGRILATGDDPKACNGECGAESGAVGVSAVCPSILVGEIEVEKTSSEQQKPPLLPAPGHD